MGNRIINMHISYLPWNKGSDPNFWSFIEDTPKGVTIHQLSAELDKGDILLQERLEFDETVETFKTTYDTLNKKIVALLQTHWADLKDGQILPYRQSGIGSYHTKKQFRDLMQGESLNWQETIHDFKIRKKASKKLL